MTTEIQNEKHRLETLLKSGQITVEDHRLLLNALEKKPHLLQRLLSLAVNPFEKIPNQSVLIAVGLFSIGIMSAIGASMHLQFQGTLDFHLLPANATALSFGELALQNVINVVVTALMFYFGALISKGKGLRAFDFLSFVTIARLPYALFAVVLFALNPLFPGLLAKSGEIHETTGLLVLAILGMIFLAWEITILFSAEKVAAGLKGKVLWLNFVFGLAIAEALSIAVSHFILK